jgi:hypothetical protein
MTASRLPAVPSWVPAEALAAIDLSELAPDARGRRENFARLREQPLDQRLQRGDLRPPLRDLLVARGPAHLQKITLRSACPISSHPSMSTP